MKITNNAKKIHFGLNPDRTLHHSKCITELFLQYDFE